MSPARGAAKAVGAEHAQRLTVTSTSNGNAPPLFPTYRSVAARTSKLRASTEGIRSNSSGILIPVPEEGGNMEFSGQLRPFTRPAVVDVDEDDEEEAGEDWLLEQELAREGLYRGSYKRLIVLYTITPISTILTLALFSIFPLVAYPLDSNAPRPSYPYAPYLPYPFPELLTAAALWSMSLLLREFVFSVSSSISLSLPPCASVVLSLLSTAFQTLISVLLQLSAVALLFISPTPGIQHPTWHDHAFRRVWTVALGWAGTEAIVGIKQGYENIALYGDVLVTVKRIQPADTSRSVEVMTPYESSLSLGQGSRAISSEDENSHRLNPTTRGERQPLLSFKPQQALNGLSPMTKLDLEQEVQNDLDQLVALKNREELEEIYGIPVIQIPVFISCLHRINAILNSLGSFLLLSAAYLRSPFAPTIPKHVPKTLPIHLLSIVDEALTKYSHTLLGFIVVAVVVCQLALALLHTAWVLPRIGVPTYVYIGLLSSLSLFFAGLALWEALV